MNTSSWRQWQYCTGWTCPGFVALPAPWLCDCAVLWWHLSIWWLVDISSWHRLPSSSPSLYLQPASVVPGRGSAISLGVITWRMSWRDTAEISRDKQQLTLISSVISVPVHRTHWQCSHSKHDSRVQGSAVTACLCPALKLMNPLTARPLHPHYLQTLTQLLFRAT